MRSGKNLLSTRARIWPLHRARLLKHKRPDVIIFDDLVDDDNSPEYRARVLYWYEVLMPKSKVTKLFTTSPAKIVRTTQLAVCVQIDDGEEEWLPLSQIRDPSESYIRDIEGSDQTTELLVPEWIAKEKGWV